MLKINFAYESGPRVTAALRTKSEAILRLLTGRINALMFQLARYVVTEKLSGDPLHRRTGILAGSVHAVESKLEGSKLTFGIEAAGGPAFYGQIHESGGLSAYGIFAVNARALRFVVGGRTVFAKSVVHPVMPWRPFMEPSLEENKESIRAAAQDAVREALLS